jgi:hypothetical protein
VTEVAGGQQVSSAVPGVPFVQAGENVAPATALVAVLEVTERALLVGLPGLVAALALAGDVSSPFYS